MHIVVLPKSLWVSLFLRQTLQNATMKFTQKHRF
jgi:hypothetical protein